MHINFIFVIVFLLAACTPNIIPTSTDTPKSSTYSIPTAWKDNPTMTPTHSTPVFPQLQNLIDKAKGDLAQRLSISENQIILVKAIDVIWPDSSLGCPQPGIGYAQVLTEGFLIYLETDNEFYRYHTDYDEQIILCESPEYPLIPVTPGDIQDGIPWVPVN